MNPNEYEVLAAMPDHYPDNGEIDHEMTLGLPVEETSNSSALYSGALVQKRKGILDVYIDFGQRGRQIL